MPGVIKKISGRTVLITVEVFAVVVVLLAVIVGLAAWRLSSGPVDMGFAKDYIQQALVDEERGVHVTMERVVLSWPDLSGPLLLGLHDVRLFGSEGQEVLGVNQAAFSLSKASLMIGQVRPVALILNKPILRFARNKEGEFDFGFLVDEKSLGSEEKEAENLAVSEQIMAYIARPGTAAKKASPLASLRALQIDHAQLYFEDEQNDVSWSLPEMNFMMQAQAEGLRADLYIPLEEYGPHAAGADRLGARKNKTPSSFLQANVMFGWDRGDVKAYAKLERFDAGFLGSIFPELSVLSRQDAALDAEVFALADADLNPQEVKFSAKSGSGVLHIEELAEAEVPYTDFELNALYMAGKSGEHQLQVQNISINAAEIPVRAEMNLTGNESRIAGPVKVSISRTEHSKIAPLWPNALKGDSSEQWIVQRLSEGILSDVFAQGELVLERGEERGWDADVRNLEAGFAFENMSVDYRAPLDPVTKGYGHGFLDQNEDVLSITVDRAKIGEMDVKSAELKFFDVIAVGKGSAKINVKLEGPLRTAIDYVAKEPIEMTLGEGFDRSRVEGYAALDVGLEFPTNEDMKVEDVKVTIDGTASDVSLPGLVQGLDVSGGPFALSVKGNAINVEGKGKLSGRSVAAKYEAFLNSSGEAFKSRATASLIADPNLRAHFGVNLDDFIEGSAPINVIYTEYTGGRSEADIVADLTAVRGFIAPFKYEKPIGTKGSASLKVKLQDGDPVSVTGLSAMAPGMKLDNMSLSFRKNGAESELAAGKTAQFVVGETVGSLDFTIEPTDRMNINMNTQFLDARPFLGDEGEKEAYDGPPMRISVKADRMRTGDEQTVQFAKVYIDLDRQGRFNQFEVDAKAGSGDIDLRYKPDETGKRVFSLKAGDAGATLKAFGIYQGIEGGQMVIYGEPINGVYDRNLIGVAEMTNFKVVDAPVLAKLLGAMSLPGALALLNNEGVTFTKLESKFDWLYRPGGSLLVLQEGRTSGNSLGLTFDGVFNNAEGTIDVSGTLVPVSGLNKMVSDIPLIGTILSGGTDSIFAATYTMKGQAKEPEIIVNPLAVLTPGILRRILFE